MRNLRATTGAVLMFVMLFVFLFLVKAFNISYPISIITSTKSTELAVVGEGKVDVVPDVGYVDLGITVNRANTVEEAQQTIDKTNNAIITAMKGLGIEKGNITTSNYSINPNYRYDNNQNTIDGYNANVTIEIKSKNPQLTSQIIEKGTAAGANQVQGTRFVVDKPEKYREEARSNAIANAKEQAQKLANNLGIKLGKVTNIVESSPDQPYPIAFKSIPVSGGGGGGPDIEPGSQTITSVVTLYFEKN